MSYTLLSETTPIASKSHRCIWCGETIPKGQQYTRISSVYDGCFDDDTWHNECLEWSQAHHNDEEFTPHDNDRPAIPS